MLERLVTKYGLALHLVLLGVTLFSFLFHRPLAYGISLLWFSLLVIEFLFLLPSVHTGENYVEARARVASKILHDPFFFIGIAILLFALCQMWNSNCALEYDPIAGVWQMSAPPSKGLPFSVSSPFSHFTFFVLLACFVTGLALRDAVSKGGKRLVVNNFAIISGLVAFYFVLQVFLGRELTLFSGTSVLTPGDGFAARFVRSTGGQMMGATFGFWAILSFGCYLESYRHHCSSLMRFCLLFFGIVSNLTAAVLYLNTAFALTVLLVAFLLLIYSAVFISGMDNGLACFRFVFFVIPCLAAVWALATYVVPDNPLREKIQFLQNGDYKAEFSAWNESRELRQNAALQIWQDHPWRGVGVNGFKHYVGLILDRDDEDLDRRKRAQRYTKSWKIIRKNQNLVFNDYYQTLCEYGLLGTGLFLAALICFLIPIGDQMRLLFTRENGQTKFGFFEISPMCWAGVPAILLVGAGAWFGSPLHSQTLLLSWVVLLAAFPGFLPAKKGVS